MKYQNIYRVNGYLQIETITVAHVNDKYVIGPSDVRKERVVLREKIESDNNPQYNGKEVRYFDTSQGAENYIHNALVHGIEQVHNATDSEIIDMLLTMDMEYVPGEIVQAINGRVEKIKRKLAH